MIEILNTLVSLDLFKVFFCCDIEQCQGMCCVEGDAGAPVNMEEVGELEDALDVVWNDLSPQAQRLIDKEGVVYPDKDGELVTQIIEGKDCVFVKHSGECALCAIDSAYREGKLKWQKPISCALYPVRLSNIGGVTAVNVHKWSICEPARELGKKLQLPVYQFLKEPLIRRFGQAWWDECDLVAKELKKTGYLD
ncbi:MAG: DUF3109 family protein [Bacteroidaceae bacterium]|nr:DUF3109 family protein [Bacteroidaceae bacterium]MBQ6750705.1 DUF3109 family protein [Bacteroidaceae bacterium]